MASSKYNGEKKTLNNHSPVEVFRATNADQTIRVGQTSKTANVAATLI